MRLSVVCPVYNPEPGYLCRAVRSVLEADDGLIHELLLVDDASPKAGTQQMLRALAASHGKIRVIRREANGGQSRARNTGIAAATGDWIGFLDNDDIWLPEWPARLRSALGEAPEARWFAGRHVAFQEEGQWQRLRSLAFPAPAAVAPGHLRVEGPDLTRFLFQNFWFHVGAMVVRKDLAAESGGFLDSRAYWEDIHFTAVLSTLAPVHALDIDAYAWRDNPASHVHSANRLGDLYLAMFPLAKADPRFAFMRRELRWVHYKALKGLAVDNLTHGRRLDAFRYALRALLLDPLELRDFMRFVRLVTRGPEALSPALLDRYSRMARLAFKAPG